MAYGEDDKVLDRIEKVALMYYVSQFSNLPPQQREQIATDRKRIDDMDLAIAQQQMEHFFTPRDSEFAQMRTLAQMEQLVIELVKAKFLAFYDNDTYHLVATDEEINRLSNSLSETARTDAILQLSPSDPEDAPKLDFFEKFIASAARSYYENQIEGRPRLTLEECSDLIFLGYKKGKLLTRRDGTVFFHQSLWNDWIGLHPAREDEPQEIPLDKPVQFDLGHYLLPKNWTYWQANYYWQEQKMSELAGSMKVEKNTRKLKSSIEMMRQRQGAAIIGKEAWEEEQVLIHESREKYAKAKAEGATEKELAGILAEFEGKDKQLSKSYEKKTDAPIMRMGKIMKMAMNPLDSAMPSFLFLSKSDYMKVIRGELKVSPPTIHGKNPATNRFGEGR